MEPAKMEPNRMEKLDRILASEEHLVPSSGFAASVMGRVREVSVEPEPIPFPWKRALPGILIAAAGLVWCVVQLVRMALAAPLSLNVPALQFSAAQTHSAETVGWVVAALGVSLLSWLLVRRMIGRGGLV